MQFQTVKINPNFDGLERIHRCFDYGTEMIFFFIELINFIVNFANFFSIWNMKIIYKVGQIGVVYMMSIEPRWSKTQSFFSGIYWDTPKDTIGNLPRIWFHNGTFDHIRSFCWKVGMGSKSLELLKINFIESKKTRNFLNFKYLHNKWKFFAFF